MAEWTNGTVDAAHPLARLFAGATEQAFYAEVGLADPPVVEYVTDLLGRFVHADAVFPFRDDSGKPLRDVPTLMHAADRPGRPDAERRAMLRYAGDYSLFWSGVFPEAARPGRGVAPSVNHLCAHGRRSYWLASRVPAPPAAQPPAELLQHLSESFDACLDALRCVRDTLRGTAG